MCSPAIDQGQLSLHAPLFARSIWCEQTRVNAMCVCVCVPRSFRQAIADGYLYACKNLIRHWTKIKMILLAKMAHCRVQTREALFVRDRRNVIGMSGMRCECVANALAGGSISIDKYWYELLQWWWNVATTLIVNSRWQKLKTMEKKQMQSETPMSDCVSSRNKTSDNVLCECALRYACCINTPQFHTRSTVVVVSSTSSFSW